MTFRMGHDSSSEKRFGRTNAAVTHGPVLNWRPRCQRTGSGDVSGSALRGYGA